MKYFPLYSRYSSSNLSTNINTYLLKMAGGGFLHRLLLFIPMIIFSGIYNIFSKILLVFDIILLIPRLMYLKASKKYADFDIFSKEIYPLINNLETDISTYTSTLNKYNLDDLYNRYSDTEAETFYTIFSYYIHKKDELTQKDFKIYDKFKSFIPNSEVYITYSTTSIFHKLSNMIYYT